MRSMMYDIIVIRQLPFLSVRVKTISRRFPKNSTLGTVFENLRFWCPKTPLTCGHEAKTEKKISVFKNIRIRVDEAGVLGSSNSIIHFPRLQIANLFNLDCKIICLRSLVSEEYLKATLSLSHRKTVLHSL